MSSYGFRGGVGGRNFSAQASVFMFRERGDFSVQGSGMGGGSKINKQFAIVEGVGKIPVWMIFGFPPPPPMMNNGHSLSHL